MPLGTPLTSALMVLAGIAHAWSVALPWSGQSAWWLQCLALGVLVLALEATGTARRAALMGWLFGTSWLCATFWWMFVSMHVYGGLPALLAVAAVFLLAAALSLYLAAACAAFRAWAPPDLLKRALVFACLWLLAELARGRWLTGLPWGASGYSHVDGPLAVLAPWVGVYGMGGVAASVVALLAAWAARWPSARNRPTGLLASGRPVLWVLAGLILALSCAWAANSSFTRPAGRISVALLQGNIPQDEKFQPGSGVPQALRWYAEQLLATQADLAIAPETAIPLLPQQLPPGYLARLSDRFANGSQAALIGIPAGNAEQGYSNAVLGLKPGLAAPYRYDKHHLVPFGEFIPPMFRWFTDMMNIPLGDFRRGPLVQNSFEWKGQRIAPNICYEDLFGEELALRFADAGGAPTIFANLSNIAWFGNGIAIDQHLNISRMRALEFQRPFVRATNTGATVIIDHQGTVTHALARASRGVLRGEVLGRDGLTPYARWAGQLGLWPLWLLGWGAVVLAFTSRRRRRGG